MDTLRRGEVPGAQHLLAAVGGGQKNDGCASLPALLITGCSKGALCCCCAAAGVIMLRQSSSSPAALQPCMCDVGMWPVVRPASVGTIGRSDNSSEGLCSFCLADMSARSYEQSEKPH